MINKKGGVSLSFVFMLVISVVAFAFIIGSETRIVSSGDVADANTGDKVTVNGIEYTKLNDGDNWSYANGGIATTVQIIEWQKNVQATGPSVASAPAITPEKTEKVDRALEDFFKDIDGPSKTAPKQVTGDDLTKLIAPGGLLSAHAGKDIYQAADGAYLLKNADNTFSQISRGGVKTTLFGTMNNFFAGHLVEGLTWSVGVFGVITAIAPMMGKEQSQIDALNKAALAGIMTGKIFYGLVGKGGAFGGWGLRDSATGQLNRAGRILGSKYTSIGVGVGVAWLVYNSQYEKTSTRNETVTFDCLPWQAPNGGLDCELCNDGNLPCSEYRCKSLGQSCAIINKGTSSEECVNTNPRDVSPPIIKPLESALTEGYAYAKVKEMPPGAGFEIKSTGTTIGCIPPFTPIEFGITTNEPSQCKIDVEPQGNYSKMATYFGGSNLYSYNHTEQLSLPSVSDIKNSSLNLKNGKELSFFMRCKDANGNENEADYELKLCVDPTPDTTAPQILGTSIQTGGCVASNTENASVDFYVNEPAECKWSFTNSAFEQMQYNMSCATSVTQINALQVYTCSALLTGVARDGTNFFVRCKDQPVGVNDSKRNKNQDSYQFTLRGSNPLKLKNIKPNSTVYGAVRPAPIELYAETLFGCDSNQAICYYSTTGANNSFIKFYDNSEDNPSEGIHTQRLDLYDGTHNYFVRCVDSGGNLVEEETTFKLDIDPNAPIIARVFEEGDYLKIVTPYNSECSFTNDNCDFLFDEGTVMPYANSVAHVTAWIKDKTYYIKCRDEYRSEPADCSMIVRPTENFL